MGGLNVLASVVVFRTSNLAGDRYTVGWRRFLNREKRLQPVVNTGKAFHLV
jgi:hypothetical protein